MNAEPDLAEFEQHLAAALACSIISCGGWNAEPNIRIVRRAA